MNLAANCFRPLPPINFGFTLLDFMRVANTRSRLFPKLKQTST